MSQGWNWNGQEEAQCTVVHRVESVAVYTSTEGDIVIRQMSSADDGDAVVYLSLSATKELIAALQKEIETPFTPG
jgi:hypothetical protein